MDSGHFLAYMCVLLVLFCGNGVNSQNPFLNDVIVPIVRGPRGVATNLDETNKMSISHPVNIWTAKVGRKFIEDNQLVIFYIKNI